MYLNFLQTPFHLLILSSTGVAPLTKLLHTCGEKGGGGQGIRASSPFCQGENGLEGKMYIFKFYDIVSIQAAILFGHPYLTLHRVPGYTPFIIITIRYYFHSTFC